MISRFLALTITAVVALAAAGSASAAPQNLDEVVSTKDRGKTVWAVFWCSDSNGSIVWDEIAESCLQETSWSRKKTGTRRVTSSSNDSDEHWVVFKRAGKTAALQLAWWENRKRSRKILTSVPVKKRYLSLVTVQRTSSKDSLSARTECKWFGDTLSCSKPTDYDERFKITVAEKAPRYSIPRANDPVPAGRWWDPADEKWVAEEPDWMEYGASQCEGMTQEVLVRQGKWQAVKKLRGVRGDCSS